MIIWGSKARTFTESSGNFYCPECDDYKAYESKKVKKYFTLYFIPLFPTSDLYSCIFKRIFQHMVRAMVTTYR